MIADELAKDQTKWVEFMMRFELGLEKPDEKRAGKSALNIGLAYVIGGMIPLLAYFFTEKPEQGLFFSTIITLICLFFFGFLKSRVTGHPPLVGALRITFIGALAGGSAYLLAKLVA